MSVPRYARDCRQIPRVHGGGDKPGEIVWNGFFSFHCNGLFLEVRPNPTPSRFSRFPRKSFATKPPRPFETRSMHQFPGSAFKRLDASFACCERTNEDLSQALNRSGYFSHQSLISFCRFLN